MTREHDAAEPELHPAAAAGRTTAVVLDVLTLSALAPAHAADVSRGPRGMIAAS